MEYQAYRPNSSFQDRARNLPLRLPRFGAPRQRQDHESYASDGAPPPPSSLPPPPPPPPNQSLPPLPSHPPPPIPRPPVSDDEVSAIRSPMRSPLPYGHAYAPSSIDQRSEDLNPFSDRARIRPMGIQRSGNTGTDDSGYPRSRVRAVDDDDMSIQEEPPLSIGGLEPFSPPPPSPPPPPPPANLPSYTSRHTRPRSPDAMALTSARPARAVSRDTYQAQLQVYQDINSNAISEEEDTELFLQRMQRPRDSPFKRSYVRGSPVNEIIHSAPVLKVGLSFLAGSDDAKVNRIEQTGMMRNTRAPDQMTPEWRVNTAGRVLRDFNVSADLSVQFNDRTAEVRQKALRRISAGSNRSTLSLSSVSWDQSRDYGAYQNNPYGSDGSSNSLALESRSSARDRDRDRMPMEAITIDSTDVMLVHDLEQYPDHFDLASTLVEIDRPSMLSLIVRYKQLIQRHGPSLNPKETISLLEIMMEDVRHLCHRSPILFRMSTRKRIIEAKDIRYGNNHGHYFNTLTTSRGIQEIIGLSSSYFNTLDSDPLSQTYIRPRFLQMLVLLLSLINNDDLQEIREFIEQTFKFNADRASLELLILKVIPLRSINPKVFLTSLVPAYEGYTPQNNPHCKDDFAHNWDTFVQQIMDKKFLIPGSPSQLGRPGAKSWVVEWPDDGFKDSSIFAHLQFSGELQMFNKIPRVEDVHAARANDDDDGDGAAARDLTVVLTNNERYVIRTADYDNIVRLVPDTYHLRDARDSSCWAELEIRDSELNLDNWHAVNEMNRLIGRINAVIAPPELRRRESIIGRAVRGIREPAVAILSDVRYSGRLTKQVASLGASSSSFTSSSSGQGGGGGGGLGPPLAIAYKLDGKKITKSDAMSYMTRDNKEIRGVVDYYQARLRSMASRYDAGHVARVRETLRAIVARIDQSEMRRRRLGGDPTLHDEPIVNVILPSGQDALQPPVWYPYTARRAGQGHLQVEGAQSVVARATWLMDAKMVEVTLHGNTTKFTLSPLVEVAPGKENDHIGPGDIAILAGQYMIITSPAEEAERERERSTTGGGMRKLYCENCLKIIRAEATVPESDRGRKRRGQQPTAHRLLMGPRAGQSGPGEISVSVLL